LKEYVLALAKAQHKIDLKRKRLWNSVLDEMATYHRYKEVWGWGFKELQTFSPYCRRLRRSEQLHPHVRMFGKYKVEVTDPWDEFDYHLGLTDQPPPPQKSFLELNTSLGLLEHSTLTVSRNIESAKKVIRNHCKVIV